MHLHSKVSEGGRSLKQYARRLEKLEILTLKDLLYHLPSRYEDYSLVSKIGQLQEGERATIQGRVISAKNDYTRRFKTLQKVTIADETGSVDLLWFNQPYIVKNLSTGDELSVSGKVDVFSRKKTLISPDYEVLTESSELLHTGRLVPIYPETAGVSSKWLRRQIFNILTTLKDELTDHLPQNIKEKYHLMDLAQALHTVHFPQSYEKAQEAKKRLAFDELFFLQMASLERKRRWEEEKYGPRIEIQNHKSALEKFLASLPFALTSAQKNALEEIFSDVQKGKPMNRLLQGDVGSGKTIVAAVVMYLMYCNGYQSVLMAPTEILAQQHFETVKRFLSPLRVRINLATSSHKHNASPSDFDILIGTHALISQKVQFKRLGFIVIDEQQRFGVAQRGILREKGENPHLLTMTATPIPRTVALTIYGDLSVSFLNEMPKGRLVVKTWLVPPEKRNAAYGWIRREMAEQDSQAFIICPFIEESEDMQTVKAATKEYERLQTEVFPDLHLGLLHGKLKAKEKEAVLNNFKERTYDILVATPVVEVGIDIPNATIIVIEGAERFGLAQLHQLRGRVGRGEKQSYCLLFTEAKSDTAIKRLKAMESLSEGSKLAEYDLELRGPGEIFGLKQSGVQLLKIASFSDTELIAQARKSAEDLFSQLSQYPQISEEVNRLTKSSVTPD